MATARVLAMTGWREELRHVLEQEPLIDRRATGAAAWRGPKPSAVFVGIGLCSPSGLSVALPFDVLGLLLPAEAIRRATGAESLIVLIADHHAIHTGLPAAHVHRRAVAVRRTLHGVRRALGFDRWSIGRASEMLELTDYQTSLQQLERRGGSSYSALQTADIDVIERRVGPVIKVGWTIGDSFCRRDEVWFDRRASQLLGRRIRGIYCRPGRALSDVAPKAAPYLSVEPAVRVCLDNTENVRAKLARSTCRRDIARAYRNHLKRITRALADVGGPTRGSLEARIQTTIDMIMRAAASSSIATDRPELRQRLLQRPTRAESQLA